jgi:hypothetical protein
VNLVSDQKRRTAGTLAPKLTLRANQKQLPAKSSIQGSQPVSIEGLMGLSGYLLRQAQLFVFHDFNQRLAPLDLRPAQYSVLSVTRENPGLSQMALSHVLGIGRSGIVPLLDVLEACSRQTFARALSYSEGQWPARAGGRPGPAESRPHDRQGRPAQSRAIVEDTGGFRQAGIAVQCRLFARWFSTCGADFPERR